MNVELWSLVIFFVWTSNHLHPGFSWHLQKTIVLFNVFFTWFMQHVVPSIFATSIKNDVKKTKSAVFRETWRCQNVLLMIFWYKTSMVWIWDLVRELRERREKGKCARKVFLYFCGSKVPKVKVSKLSNMVGYFFKVWAYVACNIKCGYRLVRLDLRPHAVNYLKSKTLHIRLTMLVGKIRKQERYDILVNSWDKKQPRFRKRVDKALAEKQWNLCKVRKYTKLMLSCRSSRAVSTLNNRCVFLFLLRWFLTDLRLELDKFLRNLVVASLPQDAKNCPASLVFRYAFEQWQPPGTGTL